LLDSLLQESQHLLAHVQKMAEGNRVFVGNITNRVQKHELKGDFEKYGRVQEVFIGNGFGFITFDDGRSASRAVDEMHGQHYAGERLRVEISYDNSRGRGRGRGGGRGSGGPPPPRRGYSRERERGGGRSPPPHHVTRDRHSPPGDRHVSRPRPRSPAPRDHRSMRSPAREYPRGPPRDMQRAPTRGSPPRVRESPPRDQRYSSRDPPRDSRDYPRDGGRDPPASRGPPRSYHREEPSSRGQSGDYGRPRPVSPDHRRPHDDHRGHGDRYEGYDRDRRPEPRTERYRSRSPVPRDPPPYSR